MFDWLFGKKVDKLETETRKSFTDVKKDMDVIGNWIKHLDRQDKQLFDVIFSLKRDLASVRDEIESLREGVDLAVDSGLNKQLFKKLPVLDKQTTVEDVEKTVQTAVQTDNIYDIFKILSGNERLL